MGVLLERLGRVFLMLSASCLMANGAGGGNGPNNGGAPLDELSGVLHTGEKTIMRYLLLDGSNERCYLQGSPLAEVKRGARIYVRGVLRSKLFDSTGTDWTKPGAPCSPPFRKGWIVYMDVKGLDVIRAEFGADRPVRSPDTALLLARTVPDLEAALEAGADINARSSRAMPHLDGATRLHDAAWDGNVEIASYLVNHGADVNSKTSLTGETPLHFAAGHGHREVVRLLLKHGADPSVKRALRDRKTPLDLARERGLTEIVELLESPPRSADQP